MGPVAPLNPQLLANYGAQGVGVNQPNSGMSLMAPSAATNCANLCHARRPTTTIPLALNNANQSSATHYANALTQMNPQLLPPPPMNPQVVPGPAAGFFNNQ